MLLVVLNSSVFKICALFCFANFHSFRLSTCQKLKLFTLLSKPSNFIVEPDLSLEYQLTNLFGRLAEHKALGFTSTYNSYTPSALSLWIPTRWSRRLRVDHPDWKKVFGNDTQLTKQEFESRISVLPFKYPAECPLPREIKEFIQRDNIPEKELRDNEVLKLSIEENYFTDSKVIDVVFYLFGGQPQTNSLDISIMESRILEWGRVTCADDPIIDYPSFEDRVKSFLVRTDLPFIFRN